MSNKTSYIEQISAKNGMKTSVFSDGKTFYSKYNPIQDSENFTLNSAFENSDFLCIGGLGNGYHIEALHKKFPQKKILVLEDTSESILSLFEQNETLKDFIEKNDIKLTTFENLENDIILNYIPVLHKNFCFVAVRSWENFHENEKNAIREKIQKALKAVSDDYSVQCRFGKIWQKNIYANFALFNKSIVFNENLFEKKKKKYTAIIAAGPTLDDDIKNLREFSQNFTIISTDTAFPVLIENKIIPDFVVSIDAQIFSHEHFIIDWEDFNEALQKKTVFILDLCCDDNITKKILSKKCNTMFFTSGHPLSEELCKKIEEQTGKKTLSLKNGRGTVTSTCFSFAKKMKFENIVFFGADFSYSKGKSYCKSTYLEKKWLNNSQKICNLETENVKLMFRGEVLKKENLITTPLLDEYCKSQSDMIKEDAIKYDTDVLCASKNVNRMNLPVLNYDILTKNTKYDIKSDIKYDKNYDIKYDKNYDNVSEAAFLPYKAAMHSLKNANISRFSHLKRFTLLDKSDNSE